MTISQDEKETATVYLPAGGIDDEYLSDDEKEWRKFQDEMSEGIDYAKMTVYRVPTNERGQPERRQMSFCFECGLQDYSFSQLCGRIQNEHGGGIYRLQVRDENGRLVKNKGISIDEPKSNSKNSNDTGNIIDRVQRAIADGQEQTRRMLVSASNPNAAYDPVKQMTEMMTAIGTMMQGLGIKPPEPQPAPSLTSQIKEFLMLKELMDGLGGGDHAGGEANLYSLLTETIRQFGGPIAQAIALAQNSGQLNESGVLQNPQALPKPHQSPGLNDQQKHDEAMKANINILIANARANIDPAEFAGVLIDNIPDEKMDEFYDFISAEDYLQRMIALVPEVEQYKNWFVKLRDTILELLTEPDDESTVAESEPDNVAESVPDESVAGETDSAIEPENGDSTTDS